MKKLLFFSLIFLTVVAAPNAFAQQSSNPATVTLYSPIKHQRDLSRAYFDFQRGAFARRGHWDIGYGLLYVNEEHDWFQSSAANGNRSVIKDLGARDWSDNVRVPVIKPLARLKPGERRHATIDASGADGADGADGAPGQPGASGRRGVGGDPLLLDAVGRESMVRDPENPDIPQASLPRPKRDGKPKVDPMFVKSIVGHMYAIHVVDETRDYYVLFRVESLERGDNCTISWKLLDAEVNRY